VRRLNIHDLEIKPDEEPEPEGYGAAYARVGALLGPRKTGVTIYELQPGQSVCPYHYEVGEEEWLFVLQGTPSVRDPEGEHQCAVGDIVFFPDGPEGAHKVTNRSQAVAQVMMFSTRNNPAFAVYPDSNKIGIFPGYEADDLMLRREPDLDYWDGER
jgi:uncharacterized cupin superfamily protein